MEEAFRGCVMRGAKDKSPDHKVWYAIRRRDSPLDPKCALESCSSLSLSNITLPAIITAIHHFRTKIVIIPLAWKNRFVKSGTRV